jgi:hypothetical protein
MFLEKFFDFKNILFLILIQGVLNKDFIEYF